MSLLKVTGDIITHDPVIVKSQGIYYRFQTGDLLPFYVSNDLLHWKLKGTVFNRNPEWTQKTVPGSTNLWAPEVVFRDGYWRIYYSVSTFGKNVSAIGCAISKSLDPDNAEYGWTDSGAVLTSSSRDCFNAIDPAVIKDDADVDWLLWGSFWTGLKMHRLGKDGFFDKSDNLIHDIAKKDNNLNPIEGGFIIHAKGWYYLFCSHDYCCRGNDSSYHFLVGRSRVVTGPYTDKMGRALLAGGGTTLRDGTSYARWAGPGHNSVFHDDDGKWYLVYHAYDREDKGIPKLQIEEFIFDKDEWPEIL